MIKPFTIGSPSPDDDGSVILDFTKSVDYSGPVFNSVDEQPPKRKRGRPRKNPISEEPMFTSAPHLGAQQVNINTDDGTSSTRPLTFLESNEPYDNRYKETDSIIKFAINQADAAIVDLQEDIAGIRASRTMKSKFQYLSLMQGNLGKLIDSKINAAKELNNTISRCNDFELKRYKENKASSQEVDEDQRVMEMYKAFVNAPVSSNPLPDINQFTINAMPMQSASLGSVDTGYNNYMQNMTPQQTMMHVVDNPNIQQVVVYNQQTGARYFDVIDMTTGQSVPNAEHHDTMFLEDVDIDLKNKVARNVNIGETYPLVIVGQPLMDEY